MLPVGLHNNHINNTGLSAVTITQMTYIVQIESKKLLGPGYVSFVLVDDHKRYPRFQVYSLKTKKRPEHIDLAELLNKGNLLPDFLAGFYYPVIQTLRKNLETAMREVHKAEVRVLKISREPLSAA
jgi:hypothetical protein